MCRYTVLIFWADAVMFQFLSSLSLSHSSLDRFASKIGIIAQDLPLNEVVDGVDVDPRRRFRAL